MYDKTRIKAWRNSKKNSYEFFKYYMSGILDDDWQDNLTKMTKKEFLEYMYSYRTHNQAERWKENFKRVSLRYSHGGKL